VLPIKATLAHFLDLTVHFLAATVGPQASHRRYYVTSASRTIAEQVAEFQENSARRAPAAISSVFAAEQHELDAAGLPAGIAAVGSRMPDGKLVNAGSQPTTLADELHGKPAVVVFYRGGWCPYCDIALRTYQAQLVPELRAKGVTMIAISPQKPDGSLTTRETKELTFTVVSDPGNQIAGQLGILTAPTADAATAQATLGLDLTQVNADGTTALPMPTVVIVDAEGKIRWIDVHPNYATRTEPAQVLRALAEVIG
jgi:peroxiredoxin